VIKRLSVLLSLGVLGIGVWLVSRGREVDRVCKVNAVAGNGSEHFGHCMNLISTYFLGYALCIIGFILVLMSFLFQREHLHRVKLKPPEPLSGEPRPDNSNPFRAVIQQDQQSDDAKQNPPEEHSS
jgi:hypothetical protein